MHKTEAIKGKSRERYNNLSQEEKDKIKVYQRKKYQQLVQYKKEALKINNFFVFFLNIKMSQETLKFNNIRLHKKEFQKPKKTIDLMPVNGDQIVASDKFNHNNEGFKYFIGYQEGEIIKTLYLILPQMSEYMKYFKSGGKTCLF